MRQKYHRTIYTRIGAWVNSKMSESVMNTVPPRKGRVIGTIGASIVPCIHTLQAGCPARWFSMYVCMYVWSSHIAEYGSTG